MKESDDADLKRWSLVDSLCIARAGWRTDAEQKLFLNAIYIINKHVAELKKEFLICPSCGQEKITIPDITEEHKT